MKKFKDTVNDLLDLWREKTSFLSFHRPDQPGVKELIAFKGDRYKTKVIVQTVLQRLQKEHSWDMFVLYYLLPKNKIPVIANRYAGKLDTVNRIWIKWGKEHNYI